MVTRAIKWETFHEATFNERISTIAAHLDQTQIAYTWNDAKIYGDTRRVSDVRSGVMHTLISVEHQRLADSAHRKRVKVAFARLRFSPTVNGVSASQYVGSVTRV